LPNGALKQIAKINIGKDTEKAFEELKEIVPQKYISNIFETADRANDTGKLIVLSEELIVE